MGWFSSESAGGVDGRTAGGVGVEKARGKRRCSEPVEEGRQKAQDEMLWAFLIGALGENAFDADGPGYLSVEFVAVRLRPLSLTGIIHSLIPFSRDITNLTILECSLCNNTQNRAGYNSEDYAGYYCPNNLKDIY